LKPLFLSMGQDYVTEEFVFNNFINEQFKVRQLA
jgi:hypothetical protein